MELNERGYSEFLKGKLVFKREFFSGEGHGFVSVRYKGKRVGYGYLNKRDKYPLRILSKEKKEIREIVLDNIRKARDFRESMGYGDVYRLVYTDSDWLPGLIVDRYKDVFVILYNSFLYSRIKQIVKDVLLEIFGEKISIYDKVREKFLKGEKREVIIREGKAKFLVNVEGQKTGFYLDQRDNRIRFYDFLNGDEKILDAFSYTGGFGIHALIKGCEVTFLEKSRGALKILEKNLEMNNVEGKIIRGDFFRRKSRERFDIVLADPPNYSEIMDRSTAMKSYYLIARKCIEISRDFFIYSICDPNIDLHQMISIVQKAGRGIGKDTKIFDITFQSRDHPVTHPGLLYLKTLWVSL